MSTAPAFPTFPYSYSCDQELTPSQPCTLGNVDYTKMQVLTVPPPASADPNALTDQQRLALRLTVSAVARLGHVVERISRRGPLHQPPSKSQPLLHDMADSLLEVLTLLHMSGLEEPDPNAYDEDARLRQIEARLRRDHPGAFPPEEQPR